MVKVISMFNNKGGVSKTTTTFNLGWAMASKGKKVLLIDADPQSNLTSLALSIPDEDAFEALYNRKDSNDIKAVADNLDSPGGMTIERSQSVSNIVPTIKENLFVLPGHIEIEQTSAEITTALQVGGVRIFKRMKTIPVYLNIAFRRIAEIHSLDYILIDMAPSLSGLNQVLLMGSDYFITPCAPDFFSKIALQNIAKVIPEWHSIASAYDSDYPLPCNPKFLGVIEQNYRPRRSKDGDDKNTPAKEFSRWMDEIRYVTNNILVPELKKKNLVIDEQKFLSVVKEYKPYDLAFISDFNSLIAFSQKHNMPVFELTEKEIKRSGAVLDGMLENVEKFKKTFERLAEVVIALTE